MSEHHELCPSRIGVECICFEIANTERERIIKLLADGHKLRNHIYAWIEFSDDSERDSAIALIKGENK